MTKFVCDRCGKVIEDNDKRHVSYTGGNEADFCKECFEEFLSWMNNKSNENYKRVVWDGKAHIALL